MGRQRGRAEVGDPSALRFPQGFWEVAKGVGALLQCNARSPPQFSLMQYSEEFQTHFTFQDFKANPDPRLLVRPIRQLLGKTHTATGIRKVV